MMFSEAKKKKIVESISSGRKTVTSASLEFSVSRKTIYIWMKKKDLKPKYKVGKKHPRAVYPKVFSIINRWVVAHPEWGCRTLSKMLINKGFKLSYVQINHLLNQIGAENYDRRINYARIYAGPGRRMEDSRLEIVRKNMEGNVSISTLSDSYKIARKTIYKWIKKYQSEGNLSDSYLKGENHPRAIYPHLTQDILNLIVSHPEYSVHSLKKYVKASSWTVWSILNRNNLNKYNQRYEYSQNAKVVEPKSISIPVFGQVKSVFETFVPNLAPAPPPSIFSFIKTFSIALVVTFITSLSLVYWISLIGSASSLGDSIGIFFATTALFAGSFFFLYSLKYYISLAIVLSYSQKDGLEDDTSNQKNGFIQWLLGEKKTVENFKGVAGLKSNLDDIQLDSHPFVSVHVALFNEKNVVERLAKAVCSFDYQNYEVILADDSTDETSLKIRKYQEKYLFKGEKLKITKGEGFTLTEVTIRPGVKLKHLHRTTRSGFKGAALDLALKLSNPKTEYVSIFDADFVPYPDSLLSFLKYFQIQNDPKTAAVQGYQWHVLNKSENWVTRGVRTEYSGSYVVERAGTEIYGGLKQISGSVYMIKKDVLEELGWGTSITEDFELTLKLYDAGYKVVYTPYIQAPAECVSTLKRMVRQRMRWAEGHSFNIKKMFTRLMKSPNLSTAEKFETAYLAPYYLQAAFFLVGTLSWLISETIFQVKLPFWTELWGWSLVLTNMISLPLLNSVGLFLEESEEKDYSGIPSFIALSYIMVPFQAYAAIKGFFEKEEGGWFRTPKSGKVTDTFARSKFYRFITSFIPTGEGSMAMEEKYLLLSSSNNRFDNFRIKPKQVKWIGKVSLAILLIISNLMASTASTVPYFVKPDEVKAQSFGIIDTTNKDNNTLSEQSYVNGLVTVNTNKPLYKPNQTAILSIAVLNYLGETVCDADVDVFVTDPNGKVSTMTTSNNSVHLNYDICKTKLMTISSDYEARYQTSIPGKYTIDLVAKTNDLILKFSDYFLVSDDVDFDITRISTTRIYPLNVYPMVIQVTPKNDYQGPVTEQIPTGFTLLETDLNTLSTQMTKLKGKNLKSGTVNDVNQQVTDNNITLTWQVDWKKGETYTLNYFYDTPDESPKLLDLGPLVIGDWNEYRSWNLAIDASGSGTNTVDPTTAITSSSGSTYTFTYDPADTHTYGGELRMTVPTSRGWSTPQGSSGTAGYTTASISGTGTIGTVLVSGDSTSENGWTLTEDDGDACNTSDPAVDTSIYTEGSGSIKCGNSSSAGPDDGDSFSFDNSGTVDWSGYSTIGFWLYSTKNLDSTNGIEFAYDDTAAMSSLLQAFNTGTVSANTWTYFTFTLTATRLSVKAFGLVANGTGFDSADQYLDEVMIGPGVPSFVANGSNTDIVLKFISLDNAATVTMTYGAGGATSGVTAPATTGTDTFTTKTRIATASAYSSLSNISSSPTITVENASYMPTAYSFQRKTWYDGTYYWRGSVDNTNLRIMFEYSSDGNSWTENTSARISTHTNDFSIEADNSNLFIVYTSTYDIKGRKAASYASTSFSWGTEETVLDGTGDNDDYRYPVITRDSSSYVWVAARFKGNGVYYIKTIKEAGGTNDLPESSADTVYPLSDTTNSNTNVYANLVSVGSSDVYATYAVGTALKGCKWDNDDSSGRWEDSSNNVCSSGGGFPVVAEKGTAYATTVDATSHVVDLPDNIVSGNLLLFVGGVDGASGTFTWPDGWNQLYLTPGGGSVSHRSFAGYRIADGTEGTSMTLTTSAENLGGAIWRINNWHGTTVPEVTTDTGDTTTSPNPPSNTPSWGSDDTLWIAHTGWNPTGELSSYPTNYTSNQENIYGGSAGASAHAAASRNVAASSEDPGTFGLTAGSGWAAHTIAIRPGVGGSQDSIGTIPDNLTATFSTVSDSSGNVHVTYINSSNNTVYRQRTTSWQTAVTLDSNSGNTYPTITFDTSDNSLYVFWVRSDHIYYKRGVSTYISSDWDVSATDWNTGTSISNLTSNFSGNNKIFAEWTTGASSPYTVNWDLIEIPEKLWLFFSFGLIIPIWISSRKKKMLLKYGS